MKASANLSDKIKNAICEFQCSGCVSGSDINCGNFRQGDGYEKEVGCTAQVPGTLLIGGGRLYLGLPIGFNRVGPRFDSREGVQTHVVIFEKFEDYNYDHLNIAVWKKVHIWSDGHEHNQEATLVRCFMPRINVGRVHVYLENCLNKIQGGIDPNIKEIED